MKSIKKAFAEYWKSCSQWNREQIIFRLGWLNIFASLCGFIFFQIFCVCVLTDPLIIQFIGGFVFFLISIVGLTLVLSDELVAGVISKMVGDK